MGGHTWYGFPYGISRYDFSSGSLNISYDSLTKMNFATTNGVIYDRNGNLQFATNGAWILNSANDTMVNGTGLSPSIYTSLYDTSGLYLPQANLIIPHPGDSMKYYLFHETADDYGQTYCSYYLYYSIVDMTLDNGNGAVISKNNVILNDSLIAGRLTACKHANGRDWWIILHQMYSNKY